MKYLMVIVGICGFVNLYYDHKHRSSGQYNPGDFGYFWRLAKTGNRDGKIVMIASFMAIFFGLLSLASLFFR